MMDWIARVLPGSTRAPTPQAQPPAAPASPGGTPLPSAALLGGRLTQASGGIMGGAYALIPPGNPQQAWRYLKLDQNTFDSIDAGQLAEYLADLSPEVSRALWDFLRMCNAGYTIVATRPGSSDAVDARAQMQIDAFIKSLDESYGSVDVVIGRIFLAMFLRGSFLAELVLDQAGRYPVDLATPDPWSVRFRWRDDPIRGRVQQLCQWQQGHLVDLDRPTIRYVPVDPMPGSPYGRPLVAPALFVALFLLVMLHDLRRVIQQQGYPRLDIEIVSEEVRAQMPTDIRTNPQAVSAWLSDVWTQVTRAYAQLQPDDTYIHDSKVKINRPVGTIDASSLGGIGAVIEALERMTVRALKTMPFLLSLSVSSTETQANRQYEAYIQGIKAIQHYVETPLSRLLTLALQAQGIVADVTITFAENRAAELFRDAQVQTLRLGLATGGYAAGLISQDEAADIAFGHPADQPEPRAPVNPPTPVIPDPAAANADPGANRAIRPSLRPGAGHRAPLSPEAVSIDSDDLDAATETWDRLQDAEYAGLLDAQVAGSTNGHGGA